MQRLRLAQVVGLLLLFVPLSSAQQTLQLQLSSTVQAAAPPNWRISNQTANSIGLYVPLQKERKFTAESNKENLKPEFVVASEASMLIIIEQRKDHADAVRRLASIASEYPEPVTSLLIAGWPAIERRYRAVMPQPGDTESSGNIMTSFATTAVAEGAMVIRFDTMLAPDADPKLLDEAHQIAQSLRAPEGPPATSERELQEIKSMAKPPQMPSSQPGPGGEKPRKGGHGQPGAAVQVQSGLGELEVATNDGQHVVVAANSGFSFSSNSGASYSFGGGTPCNQAACDGDPTLAVGNSGDIYYGWIGGPSSSALGDGVSRSTNNGQTFTFQGLAATCPGTTACTVADQPHIAADRNNAAMGGGDRLYNVWRDFAPAFSIRISCSKDSGATWTSGVAIGAGDLPRVSVGGDGFVYAAWPNGGNMMLHKFSNCDAGLTPQVGWPIVVSAFTNVVCPVPGLDRCNGRNILSSQKVAVDDLDPNHIYYVFANSTGAGNEDIMVFDSTDGGATFPRSVRVNSATTARRFMPWISSYGGIAAVSWYDRRHATMANNDLTRYFIGGAAVRGTGLQALAETDLSGNDDAECSTWPCATNAMTDSESCSIQPELGGRCAMGGVLTGTACDFSTPACPMGQTCSIGRGCPKYGDYNGNAAGAGRLFSAWSSATPPAVIGGASGSIKVYASADRIPSDFYVRDWNDTPTSFDNGAQPSTHANFWSTSDVWNQNMTTVEAPGANGSVLGDPPSRAGSNFAFAQVSRRAAAMSTAPDAMVTVNFYFGDYGLGAPFVPIGSEMVTFTASDMTRLTPAHSWTVPAMASSHLCLAVEIVGPDGDTFSLPSVSGIAPGPADPLILNDNNKAQRNLQDTVGTASGTELIAIISNAEKERRDIALRITLPEGVRIPGNVEVIGGKTSEIVNNGRIDMGVLAPGEYRFLRLRVTSLANVDKPVPIDIFEDTKPPANGFTLLLRRDSAQNVQRRTLLNFAGVMLRLAEVEKNEAAKKQGELALHESKRKDEVAYARYLTDNRTTITGIVSQHLRRSKAADLFGVAAAEKELWSAVQQKNLDGAAAALIALTERLDAHLTATLHTK